MFNAKATSEFETLKQETNRQNFKMKKFKLFILIYFVVSSCIGQTYSDNSWQFPDTFSIQKPNKQFYSILDSLGGTSIYSPNKTSSKIYGIVDTLHNPEGFVIIDYKNLDVLIALEKESQFLMFSAGNFGFDSLVIDRINIDKKGNDELIIKYRNTNGRGYPSWEENGYGFVIWNLDNRSLLFAFDDLYHIDNPPYPHPKNYSDQNYYYKIKEDQIIISEIDNSNMIIYKFTNELYTKLKQ